MGTVPGGAALAPREACGEAAGDRGRVEVTDLCRAVSRVGIARSLRVSKVRRRSGCTLALSAPRLSLHVLRLLALKNLSRRFGCFACLFWLFAEGGDRKNPVCSIGPISWRTRWNRTPRTHWAGVKLEVGGVPPGPRRHRVTVGLFAVVVRQEPAFLLNEHNSIHSYGQSVSQASTGCMSNPCAFLVTERMTRLAVYQPACWSVSYWDLYSEIHLF